MVYDYSFDLFFENLSKDLLKYAQNGLRWAASYKYYQFTKLGIRVIIIEKLKLTQNIS